MVTGLSGGLGSPLLGSMFSGLVPTTTTMSSSTTVSSPATVTRSSPASSTTSHGPGDARLPARPRSKTSTPVHKVKQRGDVDSSPCRSTGRRDSLSSTSSLEHAASTSSTAAGVKSGDCPSLESSLLSAEAAMYASSSLFFPFALPHLLGSSSTALPPFPGLFPPSSSSSASAAGLDAAYSPPSLLPARPASDDRARSNGSSSKASGSSPVVAASPGRVRPARTSRDGDSRVTRSVIVSPTSSATSDTDQQTRTLTQTDNDWKPRSVAAWSPSQLHSGLTHKVSTVVCLKQR